MKEDEHRRTIDVAGRRVGAGEPVFVIAEVGQAHDGSLGAAHAYIDAISETGADAVKFQTHIAEEESTPQENFRVKVFPQDSTRYEYWKRTSFSRSQWSELASHAREKGLLFLSTPFSNLAVEWLIECNVPAWKIASGELTNRPMIEVMCATGKPVLVSSGMSNWQELSDTVQFIDKFGTPFGIFQCTTAYPCPPEKWGLNIITEMRSRYHCPIGLSDHSGSLVPGIIATALGASMLEVHVAFSKSQFGPDAQASLTMEQMTDLVQAVRNAKTAMENPVDKDFLADSLSPLHQLFTKSIVAARPLSAGHVIEREDLAFKKPGTGISALKTNLIVGLRLKHNVCKDHFFGNADFESAPLGF